MQFAWPSSLNDWLHVLTWFGGLLASTVLVMWRVIVNPKFDAIAKQKQVEHENMTKDFNNSLHLIRQELGILDAATSQRAIDVRQLEDRMTQVEFHNTRLADAISRMERGIERINANLDSRSDEDKKIVDRLARIDEKLQKQSDIEHAAELIVTAIKR